MKVRRCKFEKWCHYIEDSELLHTELASRTNTTHGREKDHQILYALAYHLIPMVKWFDISLMKAYITWIVKIDNMSAMALEAGTVR